jgi:hypothetical protein
MFCSRPASEEEWTSAFRVKAFWRLVCVHNDARLEDTQTQTNEIVFGRPVNRYTVVVVNHLVFDIAEAKLTKL